MFSRCCVLDMESLAQCVLASSIDSDLGYPTVLNEIFLCPQDIGLCPFEAVKYALELHSIADQNPVLMSSALSLLRCANCVPNMRSCTEGKKSEKRYKTS